VLVNKVIVVVVLLLVAFSAGFIPQYAKGKRLERELGAARHENSLAQLRDLAGLAYLQASQKDYGLASATSTSFFDRAREVANQTPDASGRKPLEDLLSLRDQITGELAKGDPGVVSDLQTLLVKTRQATAASARLPE
jgi:type II secretory pathway pseudopilin PulG